MCGRPLAETRPEPPAGRSGPARDLEPVTPAPAYTGGLFNLGAPSDKPHRDLDYLLEDDEEKTSNKGLILLTLIALILVVGLGWLRWRNGGLPFLKSLTTSSQPKPAAPQDSTPADSSAPTQNPQNPTAATASGTPESSTQTTAPSAEGSITPITPPNSAANSAAPSSSTPESKADASATTPPTSPTDSPTHGSSKEETAEKSAPSEAEAAAPTPPRAPAKPKPVAKPAPKPPAKSTDPVLVGERYLYGKEGFPQNCERGLHYVKPAADQSNPKAMITMGALYATGHCLSKDLPTAYRYFALALRGDPENGPLRQNAEMVWKQMTSEERKQAIRLTQ
jgi:hypothetical protein